MKVLKVSEVYQEIDQTIKKKESEKEQIIAIRNALNYIIELDEGLKGEGGLAIKEHFTVLHIPITLLLNQFLDEYINRLKKIKSRISKFESEDALITEEFILHDVKQGLDKLKQFTEDSADTINKITSQVNHLVSTIPLHASSFTTIVDQSVSNNQKTSDELNQIDETTTTSLSELFDGLGDISQFVKKVNRWSSEGIILSQKTISEIDEFFMSSDTIQNMIDDAIELSVEQGDSTFMGDIASWLDQLGKATGALDVTKGAIAFTILTTNMLELTRDGKGNFIVKASPSWVKGKSKKYESKLAENIYKLLQKGDKTSGNPILRYLGSYNNKPSGLLRELVGLDKGTTKISFGTMVSDHKGIFVFSDADLKNYAQKVDVAKTADQFKSVDGLTSLGKKIPVIGIAFSVGTNSAEFFSDENQYKSNYEKSGRFAAGIGMDVGIAGLTAGGAAIGTMFCPGIGTVIGGAVGAGIGIVGSWALEDKIKGWGEDAGKWIEEDGKEMISNATETFSDALSDAGDFVSGWFR
ncbi:LXG domain-containing protein [Bacillus sp. E(2018)]|uniref:LXG domain-containing protein n=1 Tax=Bacillus sp. E(2018) TaxID=2502239 RepID=UPI0010F78F5A|nr:LXG domain-containing protein [Bacillus sp. E(2018)]